MRFITKDSQLTIQLEGMEKVWALKSRIQIPAYAIEGVDYIAEQPIMRDFRGYLRFPGTAIPSVFLAGSYIKRHDKEFWYMQMLQAGVLTITLKSGTLNYEAVKVSCDPETAQAIADWWQDIKLKTSSLEVQ